MTPGPAASATTQRSPSSPRLAPDFQGVALAAAAPSGPSQPLVLHGAFRLPWSEADRIEAPRHRALVLVVTAASGYAALTPFADHVLFEDDEEATRNGALGHFTLDVFALLGHADPGDYFAFVSLGAHVSNVVSVTVP